jgi:hypothetical protein
MKRSVKGKKKPTRGAKKAKEVDEMEIFSYLEPVSQRVVKERLAFRKKIALVWAQCKRLKSRKSAISERRKPPNRPET